MLDNARSLVIAGMIWVIDDEPFLAEMVAEQLVDFGLNARSSDNALTALSIILKEVDPPAIIITDVSMPKISGIDLANRVWEKFPNCLIILMSGHMDQELQLPTAWGGKHKYQLITKPFNINNLTDTISKVCDPA